MADASFIYLLWGGLAIALIIAATTDIIRREISNKLNLAIALTAPVMWWANSMQLWPNITIQVIAAALVFGFFTLMFAWGFMGGGDVKLLGALALWFPWQPLIQLLFVMSIAGGVLTLAMVIMKKLRKSEAQIEVPYGVAISFAGLWEIYERFFNHFG